MSSPIWITLKYHLNTLPLLTLLKTINHQHWGWHEQIFSFVPSIYKDIYKIRKDFSDIFSFSSQTKSLESFIKIFKDFDFL